MRILYYSGHPNLHLHARTGYGTHMREMISAFEELGHEVHVFVGGKWYGTEWRTGEEQSPPGPRIAKRGVKAILPSILWETLKDINLVFWDIRSGRALNDFVKTHEPDVIYERNFLSMLSGVRVARNHKIHHILEVNSPQVSERIELSGRSLLTWFAGHRDRMALRMTDHVVTVSRTLGQSLGLPAANSAWSVTPNAIRPGQESMSTLRLTRESIGLPMDAFVVGFVGSIFPWHGVDLLVDAIGTLRSSGHKVVGLIVGDGQTVHELKSRASAQGVADAIVWTGEVEHHDTWEYSRLADCLVMPRSNTYGSPIKLFEYALAKRPVIAPKNGPVSEVMEDGVHGLLIEPEVSQLAAAILMLLSDPVLAENVSQAWYRRVVECHTWTRNAEQALVFSPEASLHKQ